MKGRYSGGGASGRRRSGRGFTLLEIAIIVLIVGVLLMMAIPTFNRIVERSRISKLAADFRNIRGTFEIFIMEEGDWPEEVAAGTLPEPLREYLQHPDFTRASVIGGQWDYEGPDVHAFTAGVSLIGGTLDEAGMAELDSMIDDGDLSSGSFRNDLVVGAYTLVVDQ